MVVREHMLPIKGKTNLSGIERSHNIGFLYECLVPDNYVINNVKNENEDGFLKWFDSFPEDLLQCHKNVYGDILDNYI